MNDRIHASMAQFFAELAGVGVGDVVLSPGSRSTPLTLAAAARADLRCMVHHDERVAGFFAVGMAKATGRPAVLVCTSGTAAANYLPAVIEASHGQVPLVVCTADRPPELRGWGAGQTIDQTNLYGSTVRWFVETPVAGEVEPEVFGRLAHRAAVVAGDPLAPGPVHLNVVFREPFEPDGPLETERPRLSSIESRPAHDEAEAELLATLAAEHERGVIVAGPQSCPPSTVEAVAALATAAGWPIIADPGSQLRRGPHVATAPVIATADHLLRSSVFGSANRAELVIRIGGSPVSKATRLWLEANRPDRLVLIDPGRRWEEASGTLTDAFHSPDGPLFRAVAEHLPAVRSGRWTSDWLTADAAIEGVIAERLATGGLLQPLVARLVGEAFAGRDAALVASNSMPVRDLDGYLRADPEPLTVIVNRGASGIDGVVSTACGVAAAKEGPVGLLIGDIALLHDIGGAVAGGRLGLDLTVVLVNDGGGGIFSHLPIAQCIAPDDFTRLFHTPHRTNFAALAGFDGVTYRLATTADELQESLASCRHSGRVDVIEVPVDHEANLAQHREIAEAAIAALEP